MSDFDKKLLQNFRTDYSFDADNTDIISVQPDDITDILTILKQNYFDMLLTIVGTDFKEYIEISYFLFSSSKYKEKLQIKTRVQYPKTQISSVASVYPAANWYEREIFDLLGVVFTKHPNLKRILMPNSWIGYPLRKDYENNDERLKWNERS